MLRASLLLFSLLLAADPGATGPPVFVVHSATRNPFKAAIKQLDDKWSVSLADKSATRIPGHELLSLRRADLPLPAPPGGPQVIFANGDRIPGTIGELAGDKLTLAAEIGGGQTLSLPFSALAVLWLDRPADVDNPELLRRRLLSERRSRDVVWLRNGDLIEGNVARLDRQSFVIESAGKEVKVERDTLALVALNTELVRTLRPRETFGQLVLSNGCRLGVASVQADERVLTAKTLFGATLRVPLAEVVALDIRQGRAVYLSDLKPAAYRYTPFLPGLQFPLVVNGSASGGELRLGGGVFDRGLGMHSQSELSYALDGNYQRFEAWVGLDERSGRKGNVRIKVLVDGKPRAIGLDKDLTVHDGAHEVRIPVAGAKTLTLVVEHGSYPLVQGYANWADARLVK